MSLAAACAYAQFQATSPLPRALLSHTAVTLDGRVYVAGGISDTSPNYLNNVYYCAQIMPDGQLGAWLEASPMPEFLGLGMHAAAAHNGKLYVLGGTNRYGPRNMAYFSSANSDGTLSSWTRATPMPESIYAHAAAVHGGRLYFSGGMTRSYGARDRVYSAGIKSDGSLGSWRRETALPAPLFGHRSFARDGRLFVLGGSSSPALYGPAGGPDSVSGAVYAAPINDDGTLGAWEAQPPLPGGLAFYGLAVSEKSVYLLGGFDGGTTNAVHFAPFTSEGKLGAWVPLQALPKNLLSLGAISDGEYLYSIGGGLSYIDDPVSDIYFAALKRDLRAFVKMNPAAINKSAKGKWVTMIIGLPEADAAAMLPGSVRITSVNGEAVTPIEPDPKWTGKLYTGAAEGFDSLDGVTYLMLKYSRKAVAAIIPEGEFSVLVEGRLADGREFRGESMNRALNSKKLIAAVMESREGERQGIGGVKVNIPRGAFKGNPELLMTAAPEAEPEKNVKERRSTHMKARGLSAASGAFEFGPHGMTFEKPVKISLPYDPANLPEGADENSLKVAYWNDGTGEWELLASAVSRGDRLVSAEVGHFSVYQVMAEAVPSAAPPVPVPANFELGDVYVFPNPAGPGTAPKLHISVGSGDKASAKIYTASGRLAKEVSVSGAPGTIGGTSAYELDIGGGLPSGVYYYSAEVRSGAAKLRKAGKFAVVR